MTHRTLRPLLTSIVWSDRTSLKLARSFQKALVGVTLVMNADRYIVMKPLTPNASSGRPTSPTSDVCSGCSSGRDHVESRSSTTTRLDVRSALQADVEHAVPGSAQYYKHEEGNAHAHAKAAVVGSSETIPVVGGKLLLGIWQAIYFCEFDGPRNRKVLVTIVG